MLILTLLLLLVSNTVALDENKAILYSRTGIISLVSIIATIFNCLYIKPLSYGLGLYNGLFNVSILTQSINIFIFIVTVFIFILTAYYPRKKYVSPLFNVSNPIWEENNNSNQYSIMEYSLIIIFVLSGAIFLISTGDLLTLFLSIELQSYGLYIIATIYRNSESSTSSGLTYFLLGGMSSCFILLGLAIIYVNSGNTNLDNLYIINNLNQLYNLEAREIENNSNVLYTSLTEFAKYDVNYINFSIILIIAGLLFKISAAPFHFWSPDVYDGIPTIVTTFVATIAKISLLLLMLELISYFDVSDVNNVYDAEFSIDVTNNWKNILILSSLMSLIIGSILGLTQYRIKRLFAYSTISHVGFILLALCVNKIESIQAYIFYILQYTLSNLNAFFILITIGYTLYEYVYKSNVVNQTVKYDGQTKNSKPTLAEKDNDESRYIDIENSPIQLLSQIKGYYYINSFLSLSFAITLFSFVGIPPLIGFFAKQMVLSAALDEGYVFITLVAIITSVIGAAYYLNIIRLIFFSNSDYVKENKISSYKSQQDSEVFPTKQEKAEEKILIVINDKISLAISILTMLILCFVFIPDEWFRIMTVLSISINKV